MNRTLVITNDFPPRAGGIQAFVHALAIRQPSDSIVVYASSWHGFSRFDAAQPFPIIRHPTNLLLPTPDVARRARDIAQAERCSSVWFGAAAPLALLTPALRRAGVARFVASTHGHEVGWAMLPVARQILRHIGRHVDVITYLGDFTKHRLLKAVGPGPVFTHLPPGVDTTVFHPEVDPSAVRRQLGLGSRPTVVCVSRLVARKGQDMLIRAMPKITKQVPAAVLLIVGEGPDMARLGRIAAEQGVSKNVIFTGSVSWSELPTYFAAGHVFAMPCRTRRAGLDVEGLGIVFLEASASGLPVIAGDSGGAPDAVLPGQTGYVVDGRSIDDIAHHIVALLSDPDKARQMGACGRRWVERQWQWNGLAERLAQLL